MIKEFQGKYRPFSNFWYATVKVGEIEFPTNEHAYVYLKAAYSVDKIKLLPQLLQLKPGEAKKLGRTLPFRPDWDAVKYGVMEDLCRRKFIHHPELKKLLLSTRNEELQEGNLWNDTYWGVNLRTGKGENNLGKILMKIREELSKLV
jgi:ribA/ribD-fused uncharacterized protein